VLLIGISGNYMVKISGGTVGLAGACPPGYGPVWATVLISYKTYKAIEMYAKIK